MTRDPRPGSESAVSESIGFVFLTSITLVGFAIIYMVGVPAYNSYVEDGHMANIAQSFSIVAYNGNTVAMYKSPVSSSELKMYGGTLATRSSGFMNVSYYSDAGGTNLIGYNNTSLTMLEYSKGQDRVAYVDGSVCRYYPAGASMMNEPEMFGSPGSLDIMSIAVYDGNVSIAGYGLARISFQTPYYSKMSQTVSLPVASSFSDVRKVVVILNGDYASAFGQYFRDSYGFSQSTDADGDLILSQSYPSGIRLQITQLYLMIDAN